MCVYSMKKPRTWLEGGRGACRAPGNMGQIGGKDPSRTLQILSTKDFNYMLSCTGSATIVGKVLFLYVLLWLFFWSFLFGSCTGLFYRSLLLVFVPRLLHRALFNTSFVRVLYRTQKKIKPPG